MTMVDSKATFLVDNIKLLLFVCFFLFKVVTLLWKGSLKNYGNPVPGLEQSTNMGLVFYLSGLWFCLLFNVHVIIEFQNLNPFE